MRIVQYGHPILNLRAKEVVDVDDRILSLFYQMSVAMVTAKGVGLAAPQVAVSLRIMTILNGKKTLKIANPVIKERSGKITMSEGCLSIPNLSLPISRPSSVLLEYLDTAGNFVSSEFSGLTARIIQHEIDHLDGKLIVDYLDEEQKRFFLQVL